jgi:hypothetical protein
MKRFHYDINELKAQKFGKLLVIDWAEPYKRGAGVRLAALTKCDCGNLHRVRICDLYSNRVKSCGCERGHLTQGLSYSKLFNVYSHMKQRCYNSRSKDYKHWGGRGIIVCDEWKNDFMNFYNWAINNGYQENLTIDRINNDGNYEPCNCRWATKKEQNSNKRNNLIFKFNDKNLSLMQICEELNIKTYYRLVKARIVFLHWSLEKALIITDFRYKKNKYIL